MNWIDYSDLASSDLGFSKLFLDYIADPRRVSAFYPRNYRDPGDWEKTLREVSARQIDRTRLVQILSRQNRDFQCGVKTLANIDQLLNENTVAIVTGQQVGIMTGPLYTVYKTLTAIELAKQLGERHPEYSFVPVFWIEGDDHDIDEVASVRLLTASNELATYTYEAEGRAQGKNLGPVGPLALSPAIASLLASVRQSLQPTEFSDGIFKLFSTAYQPGMTFTKAFVHLLNDLVGDQGLIILDPSDPEFKRLIAPVFQKELAETPRLCQIVVDQSEALERGYHAQVKPRPLNLFLLHQGGRYALEPHPEGYSLKGTRHHLTRDALMEIARSTPELLSPNVVLRPLCQDAALPTAAYIAGPAEVAYFAQILPLYREFSIPAPVIYPRASATIIEEKVEKVLTRYALQPAEIFTSLDLVRSKVASQVSDFKVEELFGATQGSIEESLNSLRSGLQKIDPTLLGALDNTLGKLRSQVDVLKQKTIAAQQRQHEVTLRQVDKAALFLLPQGALQERTLNVLYFMNKYGPEFLRWVSGELRIDAFRHQFIRI